MFAGVLALLAAPATVATPSTQSAAASSSSQAKPANPTVIHHFRKETWRWQALMRRPHTPGVPWSPTKATLSVWKQRASRAYRHALRPPHRSAWLCIQRYEADWNDAYAPYYGGLQMDLGFQRTYGADLLRRKGTADRWTPVEQMWVAERALRAGRGFWPWPNAARICGLL
jgi:hypothetical protein